MDDETKIVKVCNVHGKLTHEQVIKGGFHSSGTPRLRCKECLKESHRKHYEKNKEKVKEKHKAYKDANYEKVLASKRASYHKHRATYPKRPLWMDSRYKDSTYEFDHEGRMNLEDWYVRELIAKQEAGWKCNDIPQEVVDLKREVVKIKRAIKAINNNQPIEDLTNEKITKRDENDSKTE